MNDVAKAEQAKREARWIEQMESLGPDVVRMRLASRMAVNDEVPHVEQPVARKWLREKDEANERLIVAAQWYSKWTFMAAVAAVIVGVIGAAVTWYWH